MPSEHPLSHPLTYAMRGETIICTVLWPAEVGFVFLSDVCFPQLLL